MTWFTAASVSVNNGQSIVSVNTTADDISIVQEESMIFINGIGPGWVKRSYLDGSGNKKLELYTPWEFGNQVNQPAKVIWTDGGLAKYARILQEVGEDSVTFAQAMAQILSSVEPILNIETKTSGTIPVKPYGYLVQQVQDLLATMGDFGVQLYDTDTKNQARTLLGLQPQLTAQPTLDLDFENNEYKVYEQFGLTKKPLTEAITTVRASTATYMSPFGIAIAAVNEPRIEYDFIKKKCLGLLCEGAGTNALFNSNNMLDSPWAHTAPAVVTEDTVTPPIVKDGTCFNVAGADNVGFSGANLRTVITITPNLLYQFTIWVYPSASCDKISLRSNSDVLGQSSSTFIYDVIPNQWQRISMPCARSTVALTVTISAANATVAGAPFKVSEAKCESGNVGTSDIPTLGSAVTRTDERLNCQNMLTNNGSLFIKVPRPAVLVDFATALGVGTANLEEFKIGVQTAPNFGFALRTDTGAVTTTITADISSIPIGDTINTLVKWEYDGSVYTFTMFINGQKILPVRTCTSLPIGFLTEVIALGHRRSNFLSTFWNGVISRIKSYPMALSDIEAEELTRV